MGLFGVYDHAKDEQFGVKGMSRYDGATTAFLTGAKEGVLQFGGGWYALLPFAGVPATAFRGMRVLARLTKFVSENGALGFFGRQH